MLFVVSCWFLLFWCFVDVRCLLIVGLSLFVVVSCYSSLMFVVGCLLLVLVYPVLCLIVACCVLLDAVCCLGCVECCLFVVH